MHEWNRILPSEKKRSGQACEEDFKILFYPEHSRTGSKIATRAIVFNGHFEKNREKERERDGMEIREGWNE